MGTVTERNEGERGMANPWRAKSLRSSNGAPSNNNSTRLSDLPSELVESIADRIDSFDDYVRFDSVIRRSFITAARRQLQMLRTFPWLVIDAADKTKILLFFSGQLFFPVQIPTKGSVTRCLGSSFGWLIMADASIFAAEDHLDFYLLNPCTNRRIQLPPKRGRKFRKVILSSTPSTSADDGGCIMAIKDDDSHVGLCRLGRIEEEEPSSFNFGKGVCCMDIIFFRGILYGIDFLCHVVTVELVRAEDGGLCTAEHPFPVQRHMKFSTPPECLYNKFYWVESSGQLLLVVKYVVVADLHSRGHDDPYTCDHEAGHFSVFMLDFDAPRCVELRSLGDRMLLVGNSGSISVDDATKLSRFGFRPNCIYYVNDDFSEDDYEWHGFHCDYEWHEICLADGKVIPFGSDFLNLL